ncbi:hypothetical protein [Flavobacterium piscis]|uniref:Methyltransferase-like protein n=1 Tax=Flavobacterium piscis TaxID=1114874 RepID=A0ABU1YFD6_9FLAO|nr:hypothetical protein [Flavobacterium piscis]MDR7212276.1 methyltransferase-like protein [Flavobacterium piscis]
MAQNSFIKCLECNTRNQNTDYCTNCGAVINIVLKRKIESDQKIHKKKEEKKINGPDKIDKFLQKAANHPNSIIRYGVSILHSIWTIFALIIGALIAGVIALAAG